MIVKGQNKKNNIRNLKEETTGLAMNYKILQHAC